jgi:hypothetical protein
LLPALLASVTAALLGHSARWRRSSISESRLALCSLLLAPSASICDTLFALCSLLAYASITEALLALCLVLLLLALRVETLLAPSMLLVLFI